MISRDVYAVILATGMALGVGLGLAWGQIHRLREDVDCLAKIVAAGGPASSAADPEGAGAERDWSRRGPDDRVWPDVARHQSFDRRPTEGGAR